VQNLKNYIFVTAAYWGFTITDGALRMLVLLHFHRLGYTPLELSVLFLLYEFCGIFTNLFGGWIGSRFGLRVTLFSGLLIQIMALLMLSFLQPEWALWFSVAYVMAAQALSGVAKDLTKMSSKSAIRVLIKQGDEAVLFKWVALLTGSKNTLKGVGFFVGGLFLNTFGFAGSLQIMAGALGVIVIASAISLTKEIGKAAVPTPIKAILSKSREINLLSTARFFLFSSRDVWFVVALPIFLYDVVGWTFPEVGAFMAVWVIGYGIIQALVPGVLRNSSSLSRAVISTQLWGFALVLVPFVIALAIAADFYPTVILLSGLFVFALVFAVNSALHSYLILAYSKAEEASLNVGFYYMANASGRLLGTLLSGLVYHYAGISGCLFVSAALVLGAAMFVLPLTENSRTISK